jgi:nucleotide-binding universal stress UspA family protein
MAPAIITTIVVPTDFGKDADAALAYAKTVARRVGATVHVMHVLERSCEAAPAHDMGSDGLAEREWTEARAGLLARLRGDDMRRLGGTRAVVVGTPARQIAKFAVDRGADCIVMGEHGRDGVVPAANAADDMARAAGCPVLTVHGGHGGVRLHAPWLPAVAHAAAKAGADSAGVAI